MNQVDYSKIHTPEQELRALLKEKIRVGVILCNLQLDLNHNPVELQEARSQIVILDASIANLETLIAFMSQENAQ